MPELRLYTDSQVPKTLALQLREKGFDIVRCQDIGMADVEDKDHLLYATKEKRIIVTFDDDFLALHEEWHEQGQNHGGIIYCLPHMQGKQHIGRIIELVLQYDELIEEGAGTIEADIENQVFYVS